MDNQTFLSYLVDSFINFFQLQGFHLFLYFSFISQRIRWGSGKGGGGGGGGRGPGGDSRETFGRGNPADQCILLVK